jgi:hypothetical protein
MSQVSCIVKYRLDVFRSLIRQKKVNARVFIIEFYAYLTARLAWEREFVTM